MRDILNIAVVNFHAFWGDKRRNLQRIVEYTEAAGKRGAEMIVFPETALTGYDDAPGERADKMQTLAAETIPGPATEAVAKITRQFGMYAVFGMPERSRTDKETVYNSAAIVSPDGSARSYRKMHLSASEGQWSRPGDQPCLLDTPWGPVGVSICYDTYCFPELLRYYRAKGARLCLNVTACSELECQRVAARLSIPSSAYVNYMFIASANLCGRDRSSWFHGGSCVVGPMENRRGAGEPYVYVGKMFDTPGSDIPGVLMGTVDLSNTESGTEIPLFQVNPAFGRPDYRPEIYRRMLDDVIASQQ